MLCVLFGRTTSQGQMQELESRIKIIETEREVLRMQVTKLKTVQQEKQQVRPLFHWIY